MRMRPDRIVLSEIRGAEAFPFLSAINSGHPGSVCSIHADSPELALPRLAFCVLRALSGLEMGQTVDLHPINDPDCRPRRPRCQRRTLHRGRATARIPRAYLIACDSYQNPSLTESASSNGSSRRLGATISLHPVRHLQHLLSSAPSSQTTHAQGTSIHIVR